ncbi:hypothetical protein LTR53_020101, partial [Teratosphaeriaceae sp. CCFEE 6253]
MPLPRVGKDTPLRLQAFINGGRLLALKSSASSCSASDAKDTARKAAGSLMDTMSELTRQLPSAAAG